MSIKAIHQAIAKHYRNMELESVSIETLKIIYKDDPFLRERINV